MDPLVAATGQAYTYVGGSPLNGRDPSGQGPEVLVLAPLCPECIPIALGVGAVVLGGWLIWNLVNELQRPQAQSLTQDQTCAADQATSDAGSTTLQRSNWPLLPKAPAQAGPGKHYYVPPRRLPDPQRQAWDRQKNGYRDDAGNIWVRPKPGAMHGGPHWDVEHPNGEHTNVDDQGNVIGGPGHDNFP